MNITLTHRAQPADDVLCQEVGDEIVLLKLASESYFGLDPIGARIWTLLTEQPDLTRVFRILVDEYEVEPDILERDLIDLIGRMSEAGLVVVS